MIWRSPPYRALLSPADQALHDAVSTETVRRLERLGFSAQEIGRDYTTADYADLCHLVASGGAKMAAEVAPQVRALAQRLGYTGAAAGH